MLALAAVQYNDAALFPFAHVNKTTTDEDTNNLHTG